MDFDYTAQRNTYCILLRNTLHGGRNWWRRRSVYPLDSIIAEESTSETPRKKLKSRIGLPVATDGPAPLQLLIERSHHMLNVQKKASFKDAPVLIKTHQAVESIDQASLTLMVWYEIP